MPSLEVFARQRKNDIATKDVLAEHGDDESQARDVEHHFLSEDRAAVEALASFGRELGYRASKIREQQRNKTPHFFFDLVSKTLTLLPSLSRDSHLMAALGEAYAVKYDGWGTGIVSGKAKSKTSKKANKAKTKAPKKSARKVTRKR